MSLANSILQFSGSSPQLFIIGPGRDAARAPYVKHSSSVFANFMTEYGKMKDDDKIAFSSKHLALSRYLLSFYPGTPGGEGP